jgi:hypothetical protein
LIACWSRQQATRGVSGKNTINLSRLAFCMFTHLHTDAAAHIKKMGDNI